MEKNSYPRFGILVNRIVKLLCVVSNYYWLYNISCIIFSVLVYAKVGLQQALQEDKIEKNKR